MKELNLVTSDDIPNLIQGFQQPSMPGAPPFNPYSVPPPVGQPPGSYAMQPGSFGQPPGPFGQQSAVPAVPGVQSTSIPLGFEAAPDFNVVQRLKGPSEQFLLASHQCAIIVPDELQRSWCSCSHALTACWQESSNPSGATGAKLATVYAMLTAAHCRKLETHLVLVSSLCCRHRPDSMMTCLRLTS